MHSHTRCEHYARAFRCRCVTQICSDSLAAVERLCEQLASALSIAPVMRLDCFVRLWTFRLSGGAVVAFRCHLVCVECCSLKNVKHNDC